MMLTPNGQMPAPCSSPAATLSRPKSVTNCSAAQDHAADEGVAGGDEGDEAAPEQDFVVAVIHVGGLGG